MIRTLLVLFVLGVSPMSLVAAEPVDYLKDVKPLLAARCYACHGALQQKGGLRLDTAKAIREAEAVIPGNSAKSPVILHILAQDDHSQMPPPSEGEAVTAGQLAILRKWIDGGAIAPPMEQPDPDPREHWAFRAPVRPPAPTLRDARFPIRNRVDAFLAAGWEKQGLTPQSPADKRVLVRRVYLDLIGLPPTREQAESFVNDPSPEAFENLVERLLASPQYGERWGRHFLDIWRYSDWWGLGAEVRNSQKHLWHWRDWVIESLNADLGYDQMIRLMLAADELTPTDQQSLRATGFLARQYFKFNRTSWLDETIEHTGKAFLGLTLNCSKCHDHKYDPVSQTDYYRLRAFFEPYQVRTESIGGELDFEKDGLARAYDCNLAEPTYKHLRGDDRQPITAAPISPGVPALLAFGEVKIAPVNLPLEAHAPHLRPDVAQALLASARRDGEAATQAMRARITADRLKITGPKEKFDAAAKDAAKAEKDLALAKSEAALASAEADLSQATDAKKAELTKKRDAAKTALDVAKKAAANPGVAYTSLRGAVKAAESTSESEANRLKPFPAMSTGRRTALANWIADRRNPLTSRVLVNHVWTRHFGQPLVPTIFDFGRKGVKPTEPELLDWLAVEFTEHGWSLKHLHRLIVTSSAYRMSSSNAGVAANIAKDPENRYFWRQNPVRMESQAVRDSLLHLAGELDLTIGGPSVPASQQATSRRRSLYFFQSHNEHDRFLSQFDDANVLDCYRRTVSIVPQQALALSNSKLALQAATAIAARVPGKTEEEFVAAAFEVVLGTKPTTAEREACLDALKEWSTELAKHPMATAKARANLIAALLNHNDFVTVR